MPYPLWAFIGPIIGWVGVMSVEWNTLICDACRTCGVPTWCRSLVLRQKLNMSNCGSLGVLHLTTSSDSLVLQRLWLECWRLVLQRLWLECWRLVLSELVTGMTHGWCCWACGCTAHSWCGSYWSRNISRWWSEMLQNNLIKIINQSLVSYSFMNSVA